MVGEFVVSVIFINGVCMLLLVCQVIVKFWLELVVGEMMMWFGIVVVVQWWLFVGIWVFGLVVVNDSDGSVSSRFRVSVCIMYCWFMCYILVVVLVVW